MKYHFYICFLFICLFSITIFGQQEVSGDYYREDASGEGILKISETTKGKRKIIDFIIEVGGAEGTVCVGKLTGRLKLIGKNLLEYRGTVSKKAKSCRLRFTVSKNRIVVSETNCEDSHGFTCFFDGEYKRAVFQIKGK